jgi:hypothetical protein
MAAGCDERLNWEFLRWIWTYPRRRRPSVLARLGAARHTRVVVLRSAAEAERFLESLGARAVGVAS